MWDTYLLTWAEWKHNPACAFVQSDLSIQYPYEKENAQAGLNVRPAHMSEGKVSEVAAYLPVVHKISLNQRYHI